MAIRRIDNMEAANLSSVKEVTWKQLKNANRANFLAFQLSLRGSDEPLVCEKILRVIPGKRLVAAGRWGDKQVVAKLFYDSGAIKKAHREYDGIKALIDGGVLTPQLYFRGTSREQKVQVLILEKIQPAKNLEDIWFERTSIEALYPLMNAMIVELATQHVLGILQHDLHFKNFLVRKKHIYTIDGGDLEIFNSPLSKKDSLDNMALFFSQLGVGTDELQKNLFQLYAKSRGWIVKKYDIQYLQSALQRWTQKRWVNYREKIMRTCTAFVAKESATSLSVYDRDYESAYLLHLIHHPEEILRQPSVKMIKNGNSSSVYKVTIDGLPLIVKRYNIKSVGHWLRRCLRATRSAKSWSLGHRLRLMGVATPKPIAFIENRFLGLRGKSYCVTEYIDGLDAGEFFSQPREHNVANQVIREIIHQFECLARLKLTHGDLKKTNIIITNLKPMLIDLDGMKEHSSDRLFQRQFKNEMNRFLENWQYQPTIYNLFNENINAMYQRLNF